VLVITSDRERTSSDKRRRLFLIIEKHLPRRDPLLGGPELIDIKLEKEGTRS
jgi:hypothetical protein